LPLKNKENRHVFFLLSSPTSDKRLQNQHTQGHQKENVGHKPFWTKTSPLFSALVNPTTPISFLQMWAYSLSRIVQNRQNTFLNFARLGEINLR